MIAVPTEPKKLSGMPLRKDDYVLLAYTESENIFNLFGFGRVLKKTANGKKSKIYCFNNDRLDAFLLWFSELEIFEQTNTYPFEKLLPTFKYFLEKYTVMSSFRQNYCIFNSLRQIHTIKTGDAADEIILKISNFIKNGSTMNALEADKLIKKNKINTKCKNDINNNNTDDKSISIDSISETNSYDDSEQYDNYYSHYEIDMNRLLTDDFDYDENHPPGSSLIWEAMAQNNVMEEQDDIEYQDQDQCQNKESNLSYYSLSEESELDADEPIDSDEIDLDADEPIDSDEIDLDADEPIDSDEIELDADEPVNDKDYDSDNDNNVSEVCEEYVSDDDITTERDTLSDYDDDDDNDDDDGETTTDSEISEASGNESDASVDSDGNEMTYLDDYLREKHYKETTTKDTRKNMIPIMIIPCKIFNRKIINSDARQNFILKHYKKCDRCTVTNSNNYSFNGMVNRATIEYVLLETLTQEYRDAFDAYENVMKYGETGKKGPYIKIYDIQVPNFLFEGCILVTWIR
jgi:hypothetical protein